MNCPICDKKLKAQKGKDGTEKYFCDCAGVSRCVIEKRPPEKQVQKEGEK